MQYDSDFNNNMVIIDNILNVSESSTNFYNKNSKKTWKYIVYPNSTFCPQMASGIKG